MTSSRKKNTLVSRITIEEPPIPNGDYSYYPKYIIDQWVPLFGDFEGEIFLCIFFRTFLDRTWDKWWSIGEILKEIQEHKKFRIKTEKTCLSRANDLCERGFLEKKKQDDVDIFRLNVEIVPGVSNV